MDWRIVLPMGIKLPPFDDLVDRQNDHWLWAGRTDSHGYGQYGARGQAHRISYEQHVGAIPPGMVVRHKCDIPACVRPACLLLGTPADNSQDMKDRGRQARGERHSQVKLTESGVLKIRRMLGYGFRQASIARYAGISQTTVCDIRRGKSWGWFS